MSKESLNRTSYLEEHWRPYPQAPAGAILVSEALLLGSGRHIVVGRISNNNNSLQYSEAEMCFAEVIDEAPENNLKSMLATPENCLVEGDLVCTLIERFSGLSRRLSPFYLLAPYRNGAQASDKPKVKTLKDWNCFLDFVRQFFEENGFLAIETPFLVPSPGTDAQIDGFEVRALGVNKGQTSFYLPTSPEFSLKKAWAMDYPNIFEIKTCFRDESITSLHQLEFKMLEWYEALAQSDHLIDRLQALFDYLKRKLNLELNSQFVIKTWKQVFADLLDFDLKPETSIEELKNLATQLEIHWSASDSWNDVFHRIQIEKIEPLFKSLKQPLIVKSFPPSQNTFCRMTEEGWADRFELYWHGVELANAFNEINDPQEQMQRMARDLQEKQRDNKTLVAFDHELLNSLSQGMCPGAGIALGLDRLFMLLYKKSDLKEFRLFPQN